MPAISVFYCGKLFCWLTFRRPQQSILRVRDRPDVIFERANFRHCIPDYLRDNSHELQHTQTQNIRLVLTLHSWNIPANIHEHSIMLGIIRWVFMFITSGNPE